MEEGKKRARMAIGNRSKGKDWPEDLVTEILWRLPVKSLVRFKCVARNWYDLFKNPTFVSQHLSFSKNTAAPRLLLCPLDDDVEDDKKMEMGLFDDDDDDDETLVAYHGDGDGLHPLQLPHPIARLDVYGIPVYNGVVCLYDRNSFDITLWNPATRESRILPRPPQFPITIRITNNLNNIVVTQNRGTFRLHLGFGLDPASNDYKVIRIQEYYSRPTQGRIQPCCAIFRMSTNSWRVLNEEECRIFRGLRLNESGISACVNGVYYWKVTTGRGSRITTMLLVFHFGNETFKLIQLPPGARAHQQRELMLPFHNHPALSLCYAKLSGRNYTDVEIWELSDDDDDDQGHWTKLLRVENLISGDARIFGVWRKRKVLVQSIDGQLLLYDIETKECQEVGINTRGRRLQVYSYEESLVGFGRD